MAKFEKKQKAGSPEWMGTYGDLVTLLLCFFIMMFATSSVDAGKYDKLLQAFNPSVLEFSGGNSIIDNSNSDASSELQDLLSDEVAYQSELAALEAELINFIKQEQLQDSIETIRDSEKVTLRFNSSLLFESGSATLKNSVKPHLTTIAKSLDNEFDIQIEGHTDNLPISNPNFSSNWELSVFRAINVLTYMIDNCGINQDRLSVAGYGEHRPIDNNDTEIGRSKNRRVDIILFKK